jgi:hypothetical protein
MLGARRCISLRSDFFASEFAPRVGKNQPGLGAGREGAPVQNRERERAGAQPCDETSTGKGIVHEVTRSNTNRNFF